MLPQDSRIFRIHILLNFKILFLEVYRFQNSEGLEGLKEYALNKHPFGFMEMAEKSEDHGIHNCSTGEIVN